MSMFQRAQRRRTWLKIALTGASGAGKTYSAIRLAAGLGGRIAFLDTENASGSLYADLAEYDVCDLAAPFRVEAYQRVIQEAVSAGYQVLVIDSLTHAWAGEGGLLQQKEMLDSRGGNSFTNWASITRQHEALKQSILQAPLHVIATMRSKVEYVVEDRDGRKGTPRKVGMAPIQRDGMEYEFALVLDLGMDHAAVASKDRTGLFDGFNARITEEHGQRIAHWLESGADLPAPAPVSVVASPADDDYTAAVAAHGRLIERGRAAGVEVLKLARGMSAAEIREMTEIEEPKVRAAEAARAGEQTEAVALPPQGAVHLPAADDAPCADCGAALTPAQRKHSLKSYGLPLCPEHQRDHGRVDIPTNPAAARAASERAQELTDEEAMVCNTATCQKSLTKGQYEVSLRAYGLPLCPACQKAIAKGKAA